jgi:hypothetical protein
MHYESIFIGEYKDHYRVRLVLAALDDAIVIEDVDSVEIDGLQIDGPEITVSSHYSTTVDVSHGVNDERRVEIESGRGESNAVTVKTI